jgi:hypothetical protein
MIVGSLLSRVRALFRDAHAAQQPLALFVANDPASGIDDVTFARTVLACAVQLARDVAPAWGLPAPVVTPLAHTAPLPQSAAGGLVVVIDVVAHIPDDPTAQGWHQPLGSGQPFDGYVSTEGLDVDGFAECLSHELIESFVDPMCTRTATAPNGDVYPIEPCDAVQAQTDAQRVPIALGDGGQPVYLSNFVLPAYFDATPSVGRLDYLGALARPFQIGPYGYSAITRAGIATEVFGPLGEVRALPPRKLYPDARIQQVLRAMRARST